MLVDTSSDDLHHLLVLQRKRAWVIHPTAYNVFRSGSHGGLHRSDYQADERERDRVEGAGV
jgi:hypothetical protein